MKTYDETYKRIMAKKAEAEEGIKARNKKIVTSITTVSCLCVCLIALFAINKSKISINPNNNDVHDAFHSVASTTHSKDNKVSTTSANNPSTQTSKEENQVSTAPAENPSTQTSRKKNSSNQNIQAPTNSKKNKTNPTKADKDSVISEIPTEHNNPTTSMPLTTAYGGNETPDWRKKEIDAHRINMVESAMRAVSKEDINRINIDKSYIDSMYGKPGEDEQGNEYYLMHLEGDDFYYEVEIDAAGEKVYSSVRKPK